MSQDCLRTGDKATVHFRFIKHPEYIVPGQRMVFREGRTKAVGNVLRLITQTSNSMPNNKSKSTKQQHCRRTIHANSSGSPQKVNDVNVLSDEIEMSVKQEETILHQEQSGSRKGRTKRGGRGKVPNSTSNNIAKTLTDVANITIGTKNRTTTKVQ